MKPEKEPREWTFCPVCGLKYGFLNPRVSLWKPERYEICLTCAAKAEREKLSTDVPMRLK